MKWVIYCFPLDSNWTQTQLNGQTNVLYNISSIDFEDEWEEQSESLLMHHYLTRSVDMGDMVSFIVKNYSQ